MFIRQRLAFGLHSALLLAMLGAVPAIEATASGSGRNAGSGSLETLHRSATQGEQAREFGDWEQRLAREVIATGQMLEGDPRLEDLVSLLAQRGRALFSHEGQLTQEWVRQQLQEALPQIGNDMASAAMNAATRELARGSVGLAKGFAQTMTGLSGDGNLDSGLKTAALRGGLEGLKAGVAASDVVALNRMELEYSLSEAGVDSYSILTIQPIWSSPDLHHNVFVQASFANKDVEDLGASTSDQRNTANAGVAYRYVTPDEQHMFGANVFFDHQWPYHHTRMSLGVDYKTSFYGVSFNTYFGRSGWRSRGDGYQEKALGGSDIEVSGRVPQMPQWEIFAKGYHSSQEKTAVMNPDGDDIWGYQVAAEYAPINGITLRASATKDNEMSDVEGAIALRLTYRFGQGFEDWWEQPSYNLATVLDRRFDKVRRTNEIRVQVRQVSGALSGNVPAVSMLGLTGCPEGNLSVPTNSACARLFGDDPTDINDVMIYAGDVPGTTTDFFVRRCDLGQDYDPVDDRCESGGGDPNTRDKMQWKDSNTVSDTTNFGTGTAWTNVNATDGPGNTAMLVADVSGAHPAAEACNTLPGGGWYLPAISELDVIYANLNATDDPDHPLPTVNGATDDDNSGTTGLLRNSFDISGQYYWSSSEGTSSVAWLQRFSDGTQSYYGKATNRNIRCARR
ncbi:inverse autotransporter beta domain-containing protein [Amorphus sp. MBR-141]